MIPLQQFHLKRSNHHDSCFLLLFLLLLKLLSLRDFAVADIINTNYTDEGCDKWKIDNTTTTTTITTVNNDLNIKNRIITIQLHEKYGSYHASIIYRNQTYNLIVDTGSRITTWKNCPSIKSLYNYYDNNNNNSIIRKCPNCTLMMNDDNNNKKTNYYCSEKFVTKLQQSIIKDNNSRKRRNKESSTTTIVKNLPADWLSTYSQTQTTTTTTTNTSTLCIVQQKYIEGSSWIGYEVVDNITLTTTTTSTTYTYAKSSLLKEYIFPITFACQEVVYGTFQTQHYSDGILGLKLNYNTNNSMFIESLYQLNIIQYRSFTLCLTVNGGYLSFGTDSNNSSSNSNNQNHSLSDPMIRYTPIIRNPSHESFYTVTVKEFWLGNTCLSCFNTSSSSSSSILQSFNTIGKGTILDSGTTDTYFPITVATIFDNEWSKYIVLYKRNSFSTDTIQTCTIVEYNNLPNITIVLTNNVQITMSPLTYMERIGSRITSNNNNNTTRIKLKNRIFFTEKDGGAVLGSNSMIGYNIIFDIDNQQIGYVQSNCVE